MSGKLTTNQFFSEETSLTLTQKLMKTIFLYLSVLSMLLILNCANSKAGDAIPSHDTFEIYSKAVGENRVINVWLPENYKKNNDKLPVLYMADGGIKEDFPHIANTLSKLIKQNKITPIILVGIENTQRRRDLTGFTEIPEDKKIAPVVGGSENFRNFIKNELIPELESRYRTNQKRGIIGESASGLFVTETLFLDPEMFDFYIAFDPSLWWNNHYLVRTAKEHLAKFPEKEIKFWFAGSGATDISPYTKELSSILQQEKPAALQWNYSDEPKEKHTTIFRATKEKALIWTIGKEKK